MPAVSTQANATVLFEMPHAMKDSLRGWAKDEDRTMSSLLRTLVRQGLAAREVAAAA